MPHGASPAESLERDWVLLFSAWLITAVATAGSLFFSYVMGFAPCVLCWYQRIFLFPLVIVLVRGLFPLDRAVVKYALPAALLNRYRDLSARARAASMNSDFACRCRHLRSASVG